MKQFLGLLVVVAFNLSGCSVAYFEHPLSDPATAKVDQNLLGMWMAEVPESTKDSDWDENDEDYNYRLLHITRHEYEDGYMRIITAGFDTNPEPSSESFKGFVSQIDDGHYINLQARIPSDPASLAKASSAFEKASAAYGVAYDALEKAEESGDVSAINSATKDFEIASQIYDQTEIKLATEKVKYAGPYMIIRYLLTSDGRLLVGYVSDDTTDELIKRGELEAEKITVSEDTSFNLIKNSTSRLVQLVRETNPKDLLEIYEIYRKIAPKSSNKAQVQNSRSSKTSRCVGARRPPRCR